MTGYCAECADNVPLDDEGCCKRCGGANIVLEEWDEPEYPQPINWFFLVPLNDPTQTKFPNQTRPWLP